MGYHWFRDEQPDENTKRKVKETLSKKAWKVDIVLSHTCPGKYTPTEAFLSGIDQSMVDKSTEKWMDTIEDQLDYKHWFCGHWHINKRIDKIYFLYDKFVLLSS